MADTSAAPVNAVAPSPDQQEGKVVESQSNTKKVYVGNLSWEVSSDALKKLFEDVVGDVLSCEVIQRRTKRNVVRSAGYGFVEFSTDEAVKKAIDQQNGKEFQGRTLKVALPDSDEEKEKKRSVRKEKRVGRRGSKPVPGEVTEAEANDEAEKHAASTDAEGENKPKKKKKSTKKFRKAKRAPASENGAPAENGDVAAAPAADEEKKKKPRPTRSSRPRRAAGEEPTGEQSKTTLLVANLPFSVDDDSLADIFKQAEFTVTSARVVRFRWGHPRRSRGYGFVSLTDEEQQQKALQTLQGAEIPDGKEGVRKITLKIAIDPVRDDNDAAKKDDIVEVGAAKQSDAAATSAPAAETAA